MHLDRMTLVGSNAGAGIVEPEPLFVTAPDDPFQLLLRHRLAVVSQGREQRLDLDPAGLVEGDPYARGLVPQYQGQEPRSPTIVHVTSVSPRPVGGTAQAEGSATRPSSAGEARCSLRGSTRTV
jgi:hypothetical protein